jgi:hypothetical protein
MSRRYRLVWWALRVFYGIAFAAFVALYSASLAKAPVEMLSGWLAAPLAAFLPLLWCWRAVGHPLRSVGFPTLLLLAFSAASLLYMVAALAADPGRMSSLPEIFPDVEWPALSPGSDGPASVLVLLGLAGGLATILCPALNSALWLRFQSASAGMGWSLTGMRRHVRWAVAQSGDGARLSGRLSLLRRLGWLAGAAAVAVLFAPLLLSDETLSVLGAIGLAERLPDWLARMLPAMSVRAALVPAAVIVSLLLWRTARLGWMPEARFMLAASQRPPLLLLRSFADDHPAVMPVEIWRRLLHPVLWPLRLLLRMSGVLRWHGGVRSLTRRRLERIAAGSLAEAGPFIAVGDPDEPQPDLGIFRTYLDRDNWKGYVRVWLCDARVVVLIAGLGENLRWQLAAAAELDVLHKVILLMPPGTAQERAACWRHVLESLPQAVRRDLPGGGDARGVRAVLFNSGGPAFAITSTGMGAADYDLALRLGQGLVLAAAPVLVSRVPA